VAASFYVVPRVGWRWMVGAAPAPIVPALLLVHSVPESPRFLLSAGRIEECVAALRQMLADNGIDLLDLPDRDMVPTVANMRPAKTNTVAATATTDATASALRRRPRVCPSRTLLRTLLPLAAVWLFNALGSNVYGWVPLYLSEAKALAHSERELMQYAYVAALLLTVGDTLGTLFVAACFGCCDVGRRLLMLGMLLANAGGLVALGLLTSAPAILGVLLCAKTFAGVTNALYVYTPEVFPTSFRVTGMVVCSILHRFAPIVAPFGISFLMDRLTFTHVASVFAGLYFSAAVAVLMLPIETRGRAIVEDDDEEEEEEEEEVYAQADAEAGGGTGGWDKDDVQGDDEERKALLGGARRRRRRHRREKLKHKSGRAGEDGILLVALCRCQPSNKAAGQQFQ
jgi:MFS transporter, putative metabolite:H+ symporter